MLNLAVNATRLCTAAGEWEGRTDYSACITAGQQEMLCVTEIDASDISLYIYLVGEQPRAFCLLPVIVVTLLDFYDKITNLSYYLFMDLQTIPRFLQERWRLITSNNNRHAQWHLWYY